MDGLFSLCGAREIPFTHDGRTYTFSVRTLKNFAAFESFMLSRIVSPYVGIGDLPTEELQKIAAAAAATEAAKPRIVTISQANQFEDSHLGTGYRIWQALSPKHPDEFPPDLPAVEGAQLGLDFIEWTGRAEELQRILNEVDETDILGNSDGPTPRGAGDCNTSDEQSRGPQSSDTSELSMATHLTT